MHIPTQSHTHACRHTLVLHTLTHTHTYSHDSSRLPRRCTRRCAQQQPECRRSGQRRWTARLRRQSVVGVPVAGDGHTCVCVCVNVCLCLCFGSVYVFFRSLCMCVYMCMRMCMCMCMCGERESVFVCCSFFLAECMSVLANDQDVWQCLMHNECTHICVRHKQSQCMHAHMRSTHTKSMHARTYAFDTYKVNHTRT
jgi:hypothetical protein